MEAKPNVTTVATGFVDLVQAKREGWPTITTLPPDKMQVLFNVVSAAGFDPKGVVPGRLLSGADETPINTMCLFRVVGQDNKNNNAATGWLDQILRTVVERTRRGASRDGLIDAVAQEIERSIPLEPIELTPQGDQLGEIPPEVSSSKGYFVDHTRDSNEMGSRSGVPVGVHLRCWGFIYRHRATKTQDTLVCKTCCLRVYIPHEVATYGQLRRALTTWKAGNTH